MGILRVIIYALLTFNIFVFVDSTLSTLLRHYSIFDNVLEYMYRCGYYIQGKVILILGFVGYIAYFIVVWLLILITDIRIRYYERRLSQLESELEECKEMHSGKNTV